MPNYARFGRGQIPLSKTAFFPRETSSRMRRRYLTIKIPDFQAFLSSNSKPATVCAQGRAEVWGLLCPSDSDGPSPRTAAAFCGSGFACAPCCLRLLSLLLYRLTAGHTETPVGAVRRDAAAAVRRPTVAWGAPPAAAAKHAVRAPVGANWINATCRF